ncbi:MAG: hypothetical protein RL071_4093 [Pseudomonadota bacterium]
MPTVPLLSPALMAVRSLSWIALAGFLTLASVPEELKIPGLSRPHTWARDLLIQPFGLRSSHEVFPGLPGGWHPHRWALRVVAFERDGSTRVVEEWPAGLETATPWLGEDVVDTLIYRMLGKGRITGPSIAGGTEGEDAAYAAARQSKGTRALLRWFCTSPQHRTGELGPAGVRIEVFTTARRFGRRGERHGRGTLGVTACPAGALPPVVEPQDPPSWYRGD